jgi:predicted metal-binding membrane protein
MVASAAEPGAAGAGLGAAFAAVRVRIGLVALLLVLGALGWWWTAGEMAGMDDGPWSALGSFGWFLSVWVVMMAAMMFPSIAPTIALYSRMMRQRSPWQPIAFTAGYIATWTAAGVVAFTIGGAAGYLDGDLFAWDRAGRWVAAATLLLAAIYQLTPLKDVCLGKCRSPLGLLLGSWRDGAWGAFRMGTTNGGWCVGCCWALMASLFALGVMSVAWMAVIAGAIAIEKLLPWRRTATYGVAAVLLGLGILVLIAPGSIPGLTTPDASPMRQMHAVGSMDGSRPTPSGPSTPLS